MRCVPHFVTAGWLLAMVGCGGAAPATEGAHTHPSTHHAHGEHAHPPGGHQHGHTMHHRFEDPEAWAQEFDAPERDAWQQPDRVVSALGLPRDAVVADLGAGTGYFAVRLARAVPEGRVLAIDVEPSMVRYLADRATREGLPNLLAVEGTATDTGIREPVDLVLVVDTYHHIAERTAYFAALRARLRPRGRVAIVDFRLDSERGPPREHKIAPEQVRAELEAAGYELAATHDFLPDQYFLVFEGRNAAGAP
jgi:SAM-dependent methyltransferase